MTKKLLIALALAGVTSLAGTSLAFASVTHEDQTQQSTQSTLDETLTTEPSVNTDDRGSDVSGSSSGSAVEPEAVVDKTMPDVEISEVDPAPPIIVDPVLPPVEETDGEDETTAVTDAEENVDHVEIRIPDSWRKPFFYEGHSH